MSIWFSCCRLLRFEIDIFIEKVHRSWRYRTGARIGFGRLGSKTKTTTQREEAMFGRVDRGKRGMRDTIRLQTFLSGRGKMFMATVRAVVEARTTLRISQNILRWSWSESFAVVGHRGMMSNIRETVIPSDWRTFLWFSGTREERRVFGERINAHLRANEVHETSIGKEMIFDTIDFCGNLIDHNDNRSLLILDDAFPTSSMFAAVFSCAEYVLSNSFSLSLSAMARDGCSELSMAGTKSLVPWERSRSSGNVSRLKFDRLVFVSCWKLFWEIGPTLRSRRKRSWPSPALT